MDVLESDRLGGVALDVHLASCLYAGLAADTGSFRFGSTRPETHELAARLLATGIDHASISRRLFDTAPFGWLGLLSAVAGRPGRSGRRQAASPTRQAEAPCTCQTEAPRHVRSATPEKQS